MKNKLYLSAFLTLTMGFTIMAQQKKADTDYQVTSNFYNKLISKDESNISMLNLFFTEMPKGGDLHNHYTGSIYAETYLDWVKEKNWAIDSCSLKIVTDPLKNSGCKSLTVDQLIANDLLYGELLTLWSDKDYKNHFHNQPAPDLNFFNTFDYFGPISKEYMHNGLEILKKRAIAENVSYIETMLSTVGVSDGDYFTSQQITDENSSLRAAKNQAEVDQLLEQIDKYYLSNQKFNTEIRDFVTKIDSVHKGIDTTDFTMRYQTYCVRVLEPLQVYTDLLSGYLTAKQSPLIVGVNIVAPENNQTALNDYTLHMRMYNYLSRKYPKIHRALHAGELTLGMVRPKDLLFHINEANDIAQAERIGHGIDLPYESDAIDLLNKLKNHSVVEINLTSNQFILGVERNEHPYLIYSSYGVPLVISTDDSGVSRNNLSNEYVLLASRYKPTYEKIKEYVYNSIKYSFMDDTDKKVSKSTLDRNFTEFEKKISLLSSKLKQP